jgi:hypothetical protein
MTIAEFPTQSRRSATLWWMRLLLPVDAPAAYPPYNVPHPGGALRRTTRDLSVDAPAAYPPYNAPHAGGTPGESLRHLPVDAPAAYPPYNLATLRHTPGVTAVS